MVYSIGVREGGVKEWNEVYAKYKSTNIASEKKILLSALTYTWVPEMIERWHFSLFLKANVGYVKVFQERMSSLCLDFSKI